jgi:hypothetical protein
MIKEELFKLKYKGQFSNSRNFISGLVNRKTLTHLEEQILEDIDFVTYEVLMPQNLTPSQQYNKLLELETICVKNIQAIKLLTNDLLSNALIDFSKTHSFTRTIIKEGDAAQYVNVRRADISAICGGCPFTDPKYKFIVNTIYSHLFNLPAPKSTIATS